MAVTTIIEDPDKPSVPAVSRRLGLAASILVFLGYIVGASIFILPGTLGGTTGPGLVVSYILAAIPAAFSAAVLAYVGSAYPVSGSIFVVIKQTLPPYFSALMVMAYLMLVLTSLPLVAYGFADYIIYFWPDGNRQTLATGIVLFFVLVNSRGIDITASIQEFLVVVFCLVLLIFCVGGIWNGDADNLTPVFPRGFSPVVAAAMTLYFSFSGSNVVAEIAGEIKDPGRNIPLTLLIGTLLILGLYLAIPIALMMNQPWDKLGGSAAIATVAAKFLPPWLVTCIAVGALTAAATSINGPILGASRNVLAFSREGFLPRYFSNVNARTRVPARGVFFAGMLIMVGVTVGRKIEDYADMAVISFMVIGVMQGYAAYRLPRIHPDVHQASEFKYSPLLHDLLTLGSIVIAVGILVLYIWKGWEMLAIFLAWVAAGSIFYVVRRRKAELTLSSEG